MAHRLRIAREYAGLDQTQLAERAEIGRTTVVNYEQGYREPRRLYLRAIAEATGVDMHWLETGEAPSDDEASRGERARRDSNPQPSDWEFAQAHQVAVPFWTAERKSSLLGIECQLILDEESSLSRWVA